jgi:hypothetical protein
MPVYEGGTPARRNRFGRRRGRTSQGFDIKIDLIIEAQPVAACATPQANVKLNAGPPERWQDCGAMPEALEHCWLLQQGDGI